MSLQSFRELLLKKSVGNVTLSAIVECMGEEQLVPYILETLEKMGAKFGTKGAGKNANAALIHFGSSIDNAGVNEIRDALGHHVSHYKAALKKMHSIPVGPDGKAPPERQKMRDIADQHLDHLIPLMHMADRAGAHSKGKLSVKRESPAAWEVNYTTMERNPNNRFVRDPKLLGARPSSIRGSKGERGIPNWHYLEMPIHPGHPHHAETLETGGYPWESVRVGSRAQLANSDGGGYIHIEDIPDKTEYSPHPFDNHPIIAHSKGDERLADIKPQYLGQERIIQYAKDANNWKKSEHHQKWLKAREEAADKDPEGFMKRHKTKSAHAYEGIPLQPHQEHVAKYPVFPKKEGLTAESGIEESKEASGGEDSDGDTGVSEDPFAGVDTTGMTMKQKADILRAKRAAVPPVVRKKNEPAPSVAPMADAALEALKDKAYENYMALPEGHPMKQMYRGNPEFMEHVAKKGGK